MVDKQKKADAIAPAFHLTFNNLTFGTANAIELVLQPKHIPQQRRELRHPHSRDSLTAHHVLTVNRAIRHFTDKRPQPLLDGVIHLKTLATVKHIRQAINVLTSSMRHPVSFKIKG